MKLYDCGTAYEVEKGWYITYKTKSGDEGFIGPFEKEPTEPLTTLKGAVDWEWDNGKFYAYVNKVIKAN